MNLYLLTQEVNTCYNTYDSCIVAAPDEETAKTFHPTGYKLDEVGYQGDWASKEDITVEEIGIAAEGIEEGVILASFNAG